MAETEKPRSVVPGLVLARRLLACVGARTRSGRQARSRTTAVDRVRDGDDDGVLAQERGEAPERDARVDALGDGGAEPDAQRLAVLLARRGRRP